MNITSDKILISHSVKIYQKEHSDDYKDMLKNDKNEPRNYHHLRLGKLCTSWPLSPDDDLCLRLELLLGQIFDQVSQVLSDAEDLPGSLVTRLDESNVELREVARKDQDTFVNVTIETREYITEIILVSFA